MLRIVIKIKLMGRKIIIYFLALAFFLKKQIGTRERVGQAIADPNKVENCASQFPSQRR